MRRPWGLLALAAWLHVIVAVSASAQTVTVIKAPQGSTVEVWLNAQRLGSATVDESGMVTLGVDMAAHGGKSETDVRLFVEVCSGLRRMQLVEAGGEPPPPGAGCTRTETFGMYLMRPVTSFVIDASVAAPWAWVRQGPAPKEWLHPELLSPAGERIVAPAPTGFVLSAGGGILWLTGATSAACGNVTDCSGSGIRLAATAGASYWFTRTWGADVSFFLPANATAVGGGDQFSFRSTRETRMMSIAVKAGKPVGGSGRVYALGGVTYHTATSTTSETIDDRTITVNDLTSTVTGGTQSFGLETKGWGWLAGGGYEAWITPMFGIYTEAAYAPLKGADTGDGEGRIDDRAIYIMGGMRFHFGR